MVSDGKNGYKYRLAYVLILVVMEYGLGLNKNHKLQNITPHES